MIHISPIKFVWYNRTSHGYCWITNEEYPNGYQVCHNAIEGIRDIVLEDPDITDNRGMDPLLDKVFCPDCLDDFLSHVLADMCADTGLRNALESVSKSAQVVIHLAADDITITAGELLAEIEKS